jgi:hypothetical protein
MELRQIKEFYTINGVFRSPSVSEDGMNITWDNSLGVFKYTKDKFIVSASRDGATNRAKLILSDDSVVFLELGALAWASSITEPEVGGSPVESVFGRTGVITAQSGDYTASQVTNAFNTATQSLDNINAGTTNFHFTQADINEIAANTAARHAHSNKSILDAITDAGSGVIPSAEQIAEWDSFTSTSDQHIKDIVGAMVQNGTGITWVYDSVAGTLTPTVSLEDFTADNLEPGTTNTYVSTFAEGNVKTIKLPAGASVADRIASPTELPVGWTLAVGSSSVDLLVTHGLTREIADVVVWSIETSGKVKLTNNLAYSGLTAPNNNSVLIRSLSTVAFPITIELIFA